MSNAATEEQARQAFIASLAARLESSGEYYALIQMLRKGLEEAGWQSDLFSYARDQAADSQDGSTKHLADLLPIVAEQAKATIPDALKEALMVRLRTFVENNVED